MWQKVKRSWWSAKHQAKKLTEGKVDSNLLLSLQLFFGAKWKENVQSLSIFEANSSYKVWENTKTFFNPLFSCDRVEWVEEKRFWTFEGLLLLLGLVSGLSVFVRQKQLDHRMYQRIQRQIAAGV